MKGSEVWFYVTKGVRFQKGDYWQSGGPYKHSPGPNSTLQVKIPNDANGYAHIHIHVDPDPANETFSKTDQNMFAFNPNFIRYYLITPSNMIRYTNTNDGTYRTVP